MNTGMRADVTFDDDNERFDLSNLIRQQNAVRTNAFDPQSSEEYRRMGHNFRKKARKMPASIARSRDKLLQQIQKERKERLNRIINQALYQLHQGRRFDDFAYHDNMDSDGENIDDFNTNLERLTNTKVNEDEIHTRRNLPVEDEKILMHYAFPVNLRVEGYLQTPLE
ncbi:uncharacterized protein LOC125050413 [Pieris napi]|uniref:uncharacterized protein LOC125050413 n=1 Tax=Pieris napi TaxID=78633 RepID=UPI001FB96004|nr:uncharacterized protein LOC125050413 [Pieris napi]